MSKQNQSLKNNQAGLVSIAVTLIIMVLLTLIILAFARITRREQQQALDRQLSTQAYYAAETGVNDAVNALKQKPALANAQYLTNCDEFKNAASAAGNPLNSTIDTTTSYTCLFVDPTPTTLEYSNVDTNNSTVVPLTSAVGNFSRLTINWQGAGTNIVNNCGAAFPSFPVNWTCDTGILRVDIVPTSGSLTRNGLVSGTSTIYLYPSLTSGSTTASYTNANGARAGLPDQGNILQVDCQAPGFTTTPKQCQFTLTGFAGNSYMVRLKSIYKPSAVTVTGIASVGGAVRFSKVQAMIDATGKANDVLRRIQVRVPLSNFSAPFPEFAIQAADSICKKFTVAPPATVAADDPDPACAVN